MNRNLTSPIMTAGNSILGKMMIMAAPNGARKTHDDHPALPLTPDELAVCASEIIEAGACAIHLHVRDKKNRHSICPDLYRDAIAAIRQQTGNKLVIQVTSEAVGQYSAEQQMDMVRQLRPEAVSLALKELCPKDTDIAEASRFFSWVRQENIWPQYILYSPEDVARFEDFRRRNVFGEEFPSVLFVLGRYDANLTGNPNLLNAFLAETDAENIPWSVCCFGKTEAPTMIKAAELGGHARIGFENNMFLADGTIAKNNASLVRQLAAQLPSIGRPLATADDIRHMFL